MLFRSAIRKTLAEEPGVINTREYIGAGRQRVRERVVYKMENILHSMGHY